MQRDDYIEVDAIDTDSSFTVKHLAFVSGNTITIPVTELQRKGERTLPVSFYLQENTPAATDKRRWQIITLHTLKPVTIRLADNAQFAAVH